MCISTVAKLIEIQAEIYFLLNSVISVVTLCSTVETYRRLQRKIKQESKTFSRCLMLAWLSCVVN
jgi:hypothetical protein